MSESNFYFLDLLNETRLQGNNIIADNATIDQISGTTLTYTYGNLDYIQNIGITGSNLHYDHALINGITGVTMTMGRIYSDYINTDSLTAGIISSGDIYGATLYSQNIENSALTQSQDLITSGLTCSNLSTFKGLSTFTGGITANTLTAGRIISSGITTSTLIVRPNATVDGASLTIFNNMYVVGSETSLNFTHADDVVSAKIRSRLPGGNKVDMLFDTYDASQTPRIQTAMFIGGASGYVGVGTVTPQSKLEVNGIIKTSGINSTAGITGSSSLNISGLSTFTGGITANTLIAGGITTTGFTADGQSTFKGGITANTLIAGGITTSGLYCNDNIGIASNKVIELGYNIVGKDGNAGKIGYQTFSTGLDIVGAGTASTNRLIKMWECVGINTDPSTTYSLDSASAIRSGTTFYGSNADITNTIKATTLNVGGLATFTGGITANTLIVGGITTTGLTATDLATFINGITASTARIANTTTYWLTVNNTGVLGSASFGTFTDPSAKVSIGGGADSDGSNQTNQISLTYRNTVGYPTTYAHYIKSRHDAVVNSTGNAIDFYTNNSTVGASSSAPSVGNTLAFCVTSNGCAIGSTAPTSKLFVDGIITTSGISCTAGITSNSTLNISGLSTFTGGITANTLIVGGITTNGLTALGLSTFTSGITANTLIVGGITTTELTALGLSTFRGGITANTLIVGGITTTGLTATDATITNATISNITISGVSATTGNFGFSNITNISGSSLSYTDIVATGGITTNQIFIGNNSGISGAKVLEFGYNVSGKDGNAGKIGYQTFTSGALDVVGAGTASNNRMVKVWEYMAINTTPSTTYSLDTASAIRSGTTLYGSNCDVTNVMKANTVNVGAINSTSLATFTGGITSNIGNFGNSNITRISGSSLSYANIYGTTCIFHRTSFGTSINPTAFVVVGGGADSGGGNFPNQLAFVYRTNAGVGSTGFAHFIRSRHNSAVSDTGNGLDFFTNNSTTALGSTFPYLGNTLAFTITSVGCGIGMTAPTAKLDVDGSIKSTSITCTGNITGATISCSNLDASVGVILPTSGGTKALFNYYEEYSETVTFSFTGGSFTGTGRYTRIGRMINLYFDVGTSASGLATGNTNITTGAIPSRFRPTLTSSTGFQFPIRVYTYTGGVYTYSTGLAVVPTSGVITIYNNMSAGSFPNGQYLGIDNGFGCSYC